MNLPETCPFCGASPYVMADGKPCRGGDSWVLFSCDTALHAGQDMRRTQSRKCEGFERTRLADRILALESENKALHAAGDALARHVAEDTRGRTARQLVQAWEEASR